jgi:dCMP deaminase
MNIAKQVATRGTCDRKQVGAVIVKDRRILASGYNGSMSGAEHCDDIGHLMINDHCVRTVHAEINALAQCARYGIGCDGGSIYVNTFPCWNCFKAMVNAGIKEIYYDSSYAAENKELVFKYSNELNIKIVRIT